MPRAVILSAVRTPVGRYGGGLSEVRPDDLAATAIAAAVERAGVPAGEIEDVWFGCANQAGEDNRNVARMAALLAGLPESVAGVTVNRLCASGLAAVVGACHAVDRRRRRPVRRGRGRVDEPRAARDGESRRRRFRAATRPSGTRTLGWRFPNPRMEELFPLESMGETGENVAERWGVSREDQDAFALESQQRWAAAIAAGRFADELVPVGDVEARRAPARRTPTLEKLAALRPAFSKDGTVTAGNSSGMNDGAAALVVASEERARRARRRAARRVRRLRRGGRRPAGNGDRPDPGGAASCSPAPGSTAGRARSGRAERGVRLAEPRGHPRARPRPGEGERQRRRDRARPPARDERRAARRHRCSTSCAGGAAATAWRRCASASARGRRRSSSVGSAAEAYVLLGLRLGRHVDGLVDSYCGPEELHEQVDAEPLTEPAALVEQGDALLAAARGRLAARPGARPAHLRGRARRRGPLVLRRGRALLRRPAAARRHRTSTRPSTSGSTSCSRARADLAERYETWRTAQPVPADGGARRAGDSSTSCARRPPRSSSCRRARRLVVEEVRDEPWWAFNYYLGDLRSRVVVNLDVPTTCDDVVELAAHEVYPGHHTEHSVKEQRLLRDRGQVEESIQLVPTPAALVSEGIAETGPDIVLGGDLRGAARRESSAAHGLEYDLDQARAVREARRPIRRIGLDAALMIHEDGGLDRGGPGVHPALGARPRPSRRRTASVSSSTRPGALT